MKINRILLIYCVLAVLQAPDANAGDKTASTRRPVVLTGHPEAHAFGGALQLSGTAEPNQTVKLYAMTGGFLKRVNADIGDFVKAGQVLAVLENPDLDSDKTRLAAELKGKKAIYERLKNIVEKTPQLTMLADVDKARADYESAGAQLDGVLTRIGLLTVKAPFAGVITRRHADKGAAIQSGLSETDASALFDLQDIRIIRLRVDVPETDAASIDKNATASVVFPELPEPRFEAKVSRLAYGLDSTTRTMRVEIDLGNAGYQIRPGMYAKVALTHGQKHSVLAVPNEAVGNIKGKSFVFLVRDGKAVKVEVSTGRRDEHFTEVTASALTHRDAVIVQGKELVSDGAPVEVKSP
ncbi:MAG: efflux RND transporter periplasmic adaptor subunit [Gammaproteobacteria bacterium]